MADDFTIIFEPAEEGGFTAYIPELAGAISEGESIEQARFMVLDAARELLAYRREKALREMASDAHAETVRLSA